MQTMVESPGEVVPMPKRTLEDVALSELAKALEMETPEEARLPRSTFYRWQSGDIPLALRLIARQPRLVRALLKDAERIAALSENGKRTAKN